MAMHLWKTGDAVRITYQGTTVDGTIRLASDNGVSLMLEFEAILGGYAGMMPVLWDETTATFRGLIYGEPVELTLEQVQAEPQAALPLFDAQRECDLVFCFHGAALIALRAGDDRAKETAEQLWHLLPFIKALCRVGRAHEAELIAAWKQALQEPMPFGCAPVGLPKEDAKP